MSFLESGGTPQELMDCTLWDNGVPASILDAWRNAQRWMRKWEGFEFWTGWYRSVIGRRAMAKTLLREVARIEPSDWSLGPKHVSNIIEKIELAWIRASSPLAETIEWIPDTRKLRAVPVPLANVSVWDTVIDKLRDALNDIQREGALKQQHAALADVVATLERTVSCYADNPQRVHDDMNNALLEIGDLLAGGEIAKDSRLRTFRRTLETNSTDICAWSPEVAESVWRRTMVRVEQLSDADQDILRSSALTAAEHTEGTLQTDLREDVTMVMPTTLGEPRFGSDVPAKKPRKGVCGLSSRQSSVSHARAIARACARRIQKIHNRSPRGIFQAATHRIETGKHQNPWGRSGSSTTHSRHRRQAPTSRPWSH